MANAPRGVDVRAAGSRIVVRASLKDSTGAKVTSGSATLRLYELQDDGSLKSYDFNDNTFKTGALTTATAALTHRQGNNSTVDTGLWTYALTTLTGFATGGIYFAVVEHASASPAAQEREFQYGGAEGDMVVQTGDSYTRLGAPAGASIAADIAQVAGFTDTLEASAATIQGYTDTLESAVATLQGVANTINTNTDTVEATQATIAGYTDTLEATLATLTTAINTINTNTDSLEAGQATLQGYTDTLESAVTAVASAIIAARAVIDTINSNTDTLETSAATLAGYTDTLESGVSSLQTGLTTLQGYTDTLEAGVATLQGYSDTLESRLPDTLEDGRMKATLSGEAVTLPDPAPEGYGGGGLTEEQAANIALIDDIAERVEEQVPGDDPVVIIPAPANPAYRAVVLDITKFGQGQLGSLEDRAVSAQLVSSYPAYVTEFLDSGYNDSGTTDEDGRYVFYLVPGYQYQFYIGGQRVKTGTVPNSGSGPFYVAQLS